MNGICGVIAVNGICGLIENEIRPQIARLRADQRTLDDRMARFEAWASGIEATLVEMKNDLGMSLQVVLSKLDKLADRVGAEK